MPAAVKDAAKAGNHHVPGLFEVDVARQGDIFVPGPGVQLAVLRQLKQLFLCGYVDYRVLALRFGPPLGGLPGNELTKCGMLLRRHGQHIPQRQGAGQNPCQYRGGLCYPESPCRFGRFLQPGLFRWPAYFCRPVYFRWPGFFCWPEHFRSPGFFCWPEHFRCPGYLCRSAPPGHYG